jgi:hypothetical protein
MFLPWSSLLFEARNDEINYSEEQQWIAECHRLSECRTWSLRIRVCVLGGGCHMCNILSFRHFIMFPSFLGGTSAVIECFIAQSRDQ